MHPRLPGCRQTEGDAPTVGLSCRGGPERVNLTQTAAVHQAGRLPMSLTGTWPAKQNLSRQRTDIPSQAVRVSACGGGWPSVGAGRCWGREHVCRSGRLLTMERMYMMGLSWDSWLI